MINAFRSGDCSRKLLILGLFRKLLEECLTSALMSITGMPEGIFSKQKIQLFGGLGIEFFCHLEYFMTI
jgi:hypothetical protein